jgi:putative intracellular protease/amidase
MGSIVCFVPEAYADFEVTLALHLAKDVGKRKIVTAGYTREPVTSYSGIKTVADLTLTEAASITDLEAFIMPGGPLREHDERLSSFLQTLDRDGRLLAAICFGPQYMARAGILQNRRFTTSCSPANIKRKGIADPFPRENFVNDRVVTDGNVITAQGHAFVDFAFAIARYLGFYEENKAGLDMLYDAVTNR